MESLCFLAMVKLNCTSDLDAVTSPWFRSLLVKIRSYLSLDGLGFLDRCFEAAAKLFPSYWNMYGPSDLTRKIRKDGKISTLSPMDKSFIFRNESRVEVSDYLQRLDDLVYLFLGERLSSEERKLESDKLTFLSYCGVIIPELKYAVNLIFADFFGTDRPAESKLSLGYQIFPRRLVVFLKRLVLKQSSRSSFKIKDGIAFYTLFQGLKKGFLPIRPDSIEASLIKHKKALTQSGQVSQELLDSIENILRKEFRDLPEFVWDGFRKEDKLSVRATVESNLASKGQVGWAERQIYENESGPLPEPPQFAGFISTRFDTPKSVYINYLFATNGEVHDRLTIQKKEFLVQPAIVLEPMKARIITKPSVGLYQNMHTIQERMWEYLKKRREFALIGRPVTVEDINYISNGWTTGEFFNSGDFDGATDNLKSMISDHILKFVLTQFEIHATYLEDGFLKDLYERCLRSFTRSNISYVLTDLDKSEGFYAAYNPGCQGLKEEVVEQTNGQLMGHILSFPILCIANYCAFRLAVPDNIRSRRPVLINGDDILFRCTRKEYQNWCEVTRSFGFFPSVGKNLLSDKLCQINSVLFRINTASYLSHDIPIYFYRGCDVVPYVNFGIMTGRKKGCTVEKVSGTETIPRKVEDRFPVLPDLLQYSYFLMREDWKSRVFELFKRNNHELWELSLSPEILFMKTVWPGNSFYRSVKETRSISEQVLGRAYFSCRGPTVPTLSLKKLKRAERWYRSFPFSSFDFWAKEDEEPVRFDPISRSVRFPAGDSGDLQEISVTEDVEEGRREAPDTSSRGTFSAFVDCVSLVFVPDPEVKPDSVNPAFPFGEGEPSCYSLTFNVSFNCAGSLLYQD